MTGFWFSESCFKPNNIGDLNMAREPLPPAHSLAQLWRPTAYSDELAARIANAIGGGTPLGLVPELDGMPARATLDIWTSNNKRFRIRCARACAFYADRVADDYFEIADGAEASPAHAPTGAPEHPSRARLRVETRRWLAGKLAPATYNVRATSGDAATEFNQQRLTQGEKRWGA